jgi:hypothetical protein
MRGESPTPPNRFVGFVPLLSHADLPHARECHASTEVAGRPATRTYWQGPAGMPDWVET